MMGVRFEEIMKRLPPERQKRVEERGRQLIAEEMARRDLRKACAMDASVSRENSRRRTG